MAMRASSSVDFTSIILAGDVISWPQAIGEPLGLTRALMAQKQHLPAFKLFVGMTSSDTLSAANVGGGLLGLNGAGTNRRLAASGLIDIVPTHVSRVPELIRKGVIRIDVALVRVRPTKHSNTFSVGVICDYTTAMIKSARCVVAEIDERLPLTAHDALVSRDDIDIFTLADTDEILMPDPEPSAVESEVARRIAEMIPDRATVQLGIGTLPVAVGRALFNHRDLGVHSGVVSDIFVDLVERGVVTNAYKGLDPGESAIGGLFGTRRLLDHATNNSSVAMRSVEYTHQPACLARVRALHSINSAVEIDLTGQVNSELAGGRYLGAVGGQVDFVRGARLSPGGRSIIAVPSTTPDVKQSRIVADLCGRPVTTARSDVDLIVTEYGVADLWGQPFSERAKRLIAIAHPAFRDELSAALIRNNMPTRIA